MSQNTEEKTERKETFAHVYFIWDLKMHKCFRGLNTPVLSVFFLFFVFFWHHSVNDLKPGTSPGQSKAFACSNFTRLGWKLFICLKQYFE